MSNTFKFAIALVATLGAASAVSAASINADGVQGKANSIIIDHVNTDVAGYIEVRELVGGEVGKVIGTKSVNAGARSEFLLKLDKQPRQGVVATLFQNGSNTSVDSVEIDIN